MSKSSVETCHLWQIQHESTTGQDNDWISVTIGVTIVDYFLKITSIVLRDQVKFMTFCLDLG